MSILPAWVLTIPENNDPKYFNWLVTKATANGVPDHVVEHLVRKYFSIPQPEGLSVALGRVELYYESGLTAQHVFNKIEELIYE